jgi:hypothetical protein
MGRIGFILLVVWLSTLAPASADCKTHHGDHIVLYSTTDDPSVLVWDSRSRLREYNGASFDVAQAMMPHAVLVRPGTHATVLSCVPASVESPLFQKPDDAIDIIISTGPRHGAAGWVLGSDVRSPHSKR